ncbi:hypothetical protein ACIRRI_06895 [Streptomyces mirabilis]|uniref:hypothetical protein n=1 Tax=Streptomyces mirabilis TaxID=68239 RepID=UPI0037FF1888
MTKQLTTQNATITTATIQVQAMTIGARQVTLSVFRQLLEEPLIADDGTLNGVPWGAVNYHPDKCGDQARHWHIVWQHGQELRRGRVYEKPFFDESGHRFRSATTDTYAAHLLSEWAHGRVGWCPLVEDDLTSRTFRQGYFCRWRTDDMSVEGLVQEHVQRHIIQAVESAKARLHAVERAHSEHPNDFQLKQLEASREDLKEAAAALDALLAALPPLDEVRGAYDTEVAGERSRRQRHRGVLATLAELPQLFIAV